jgi:spermidine synthase
MILRDDGDFGIRHHEPDSCAWRGMLHLDSASSTPDNDGVSTSPLLICTMSEPQRILIVGGGQGIGWEVTKAILRLSSQARIAVFGIHLEEEVQNLPTTANGRVPVVRE